MAAIKTGNGRSGSTTWRYDGAKVRRSRREGQQDVPKAPRWGRLARRNPRESLTIKVTYRGGAACWYLVEARGSYGPVSGATALHDLMREVTGAHDI